MMRVGLGLAVCLVVVFIDYRYLVDNAFALYAGSLALLFTVLLVGTEINGSKSWVSLAGVRLQPSELTKIVIILVLARYLADLNERFLTKRQLLGIAAFCFPPVVLIILQRDLGTAVMYVPIVGGIVLGAGSRRKVLLTTIAVVLLAAPVGWFALKDYQRQRVLVTLDPELDPQGIGYQARQSQIAIGSGGVMGRGLGNGLQTQLDYLPESHTDFIFALLAEETGLVGAALILALYLVFLLRLVGVAESARDRAGILVVVGVFCMIFSHVFINVGMALGIMPAIGIPLPLLSYGGSSILTTFIAIGLVLNIHLHRYVYS
jgi:rod shape determining protein RodA